MSSTFFRLIALSFLIFVSAVSAHAQQGMAIDPATCLGCHSDRFSIKDFAASVHGKNGCVGCHVDITDLAKHMKREIKVQKVQCERCHKRENAEYLTSVHAEKKVTCAKCHTDVHVHKYWNNDKRIVVAKCIQCHDKEAAYQKSIHGKGVAAGNPDSAACHDCHGLHTVDRRDETTDLTEKKVLGTKCFRCHDKETIYERSVHTKATMPGNPYATTCHDCHNHHINDNRAGTTERSGREFHTKVCMRCHSNTEMMKRNKIYKVAVKTYMESYHGKNFRLGSSGKVAGCSDCHTAHAVLPMSDPASSVNPANILTTCKKCHKKATVSFTKYYAHADPMDRKNFPVLFYTLVGMTSIIAGTFLVFGVHTILWMFRGFVENRLKINKPH